MQDNWDDVLKEKTEGFEAEPSGEVWNKINTSLNRKKKKAIWIWIALPAAAVIIFLLRMSFGNEEIMKNDQPLASHIDTLPVKKTVPETLAVTPEENAEFPLKSTPIQQKQRFEKKKENLVAKVDDDIDSNAKEQITIQPEPRKKRKPIGTEIHILYEVDSTGNLAAIDSLTQTKEENISVPAVPHALQKETPVFASIVNATTTLLGIDAGWNEEVADDERRVTTHADLGFISFRRTKTFRNQ